MLAIVGAVALWALARAPLPTLLLIAVVGGLSDHGVLPAPRLELADRAAAMRTQMTGRALCERRAAVALLGDVELTEQLVEDLQRDCGAPPPQ